MFDATNSTIERRQLILEIVVKKRGFKLFFVESVCDDPKIVEQNIMVKLIVYYIIPNGIIALCISYIMLIVFVHNAVVSNLF